MALSNLQALSLIGVGLFLFIKQQNKTINLEFFIAIVIVGYGALKIIDYFNSVSKRKREIEKDIIEREED